MYLAQSFSQVCLDAECAAKQLHARNIGELAEAVQWAGFAIAAALVLLAVVVFKTGRDHSGR